MVQEQARLKNHPNVLASTQPNNQKQRTQENRPRLPHTPKMELEANRRVFKSNMENGNAPRGEAEEEKYCYFHQRKGHLLNECKAFEKEGLEAKDEFIRQVGLCFRCLSQGHRSTECSAAMKCAKCGDCRHATVLYKEKPKATRREHGDELQTACTAVCRDPHSVGFSCSKIVVVDVFNENLAQEPYRVYAVLDDQSKASMISPNLVDKLGATGPSLKYLLSTCSGDKEERGLGEEFPALSYVLWQDKGEIITPEMATQFPYLKEIAEEIPAYDQKAKVEILIGRDAPELLKIRESRNGSKGAPWAQRLDLGGTVSDQMCLDRVGGPVHISARRTAVEYPDPKLSFSWSSEDIRCKSAKHEIVPCPDQYKIRERYAEKGETGADLFRTSPDDNMVSLSGEDRRFLDIVEPPWTRIQKNQCGNWQMSLPLRRLNIAIPDYRSLAVNRLNGLLRTLKKKPKLKEDYFPVCGQGFERGHAVPLPREELSVTTCLRRNEPNKHGPQDQEQTAPIRSGDQENVAAMCDIEQMFHSLHMSPEHQNFLRFLWFKDNDPSKEVIEYKMTVHLFGNGPSPAIATFGLRKMADDGEEKYGKATRDFVY
ncbi:uncharacterized protein LOC111346173 [Stylophora pistillata]|uniref:uncharacterized protein LOC111346173 n=1 Tax=Stylophora pistillata TaxID=50429 RepID=UPI000C04A949|nr:uncharacterized protein LOC111346173 [Stylophora pistillata]